MHMIFCGTCDTQPAASPAPALLTKEHLDSIVQRLRARREVLDHSAEGGYRMAGPSGNELKAALAIDQLRQHIAALEQRVGAADKLAATADRAHSVMLAHMNPHYRAEIAASGRSGEFDGWAMCQELRRELDAYAALPKEPR